MLIGSPSMVALGHHPTIPWNQFWGALDHGATLLARLPTATAADGRGGLQCSHQCSSDLNRCFSYQRMGGTIQNPGKTIRKYDFDVADFERQKSWLSVWYYMFFCLERMVVLPLKIVVLGPQLELLSWRFSTSNSDCCKPNAINLLFAGGWFENNPLLVDWGWSMAACDICWFQLSKNPKMEDNHPKIED